MEDANFKYKKLVYRMGYTLLLCMGILFGFGSYLGAGQITGTKILLMLGILAFLGTMQVGGFRVRSVCTIALCVCAVMILLVWGGENVTAFFHTYWNWLFQKEWHDEWEAGYQFLQVGWVTLFCYVLQCVIDKIYVIQIGISLGYMCYLLYGMFTGKLYLQKTVAVMLGYIVLTYVEYKEKHWKKEKTQNSKIYMVWMLPFYLLFILALTVTPVSEKPYDWNFAKHFYAQVKENITVWYENVTRNNREDFGKAVCGFSEDGKLMSGLIPDNRELMTIQGKQNLETNVYLMGKVYDTFLGQEWIQTQQSSQQERLLDTIETLCAVTYVEPDLPQNYVENARLDIRYEHFNTGYVFAPLKTWKVDGITYDSRNADMVLEEQKGYATEYSIMFYQMNVDHPAFYEMMETDVKQDEELWNMVKRKNVASKEQYCSFEELESYREKIHDIYEDDLALSEDLKKYISTVTEKAQTPLQRLRAIEKELASYTYTLQPGKLPDEVTNAEEFLEYFLLESKKGYCSYYATAFVLLARVEGFPARYVEGFCVPMNKEEKVTVYADMAHAWPEVYFDGIGWIPFEPTPGYAKIRYTPWELITKKDSQKSVEEEPQEDWSDENESIGEAPQTEKEPESKRRILTIIGVALGAMIAASMGMLMLDRFLRKKKQKNMSTEERFLSLLQMEFKILEKLGVKREQSQTLQEFQENTIEPFLEQRGITMTTFQTISWYEDYLYGKKDITEEMLLQAQNEKLVLMELLKKEKKVYYYLITYLLGFA